MCKNLINSNRTFGATHTPGVAEIARCQAHWVLTVLWFLINLSMNEGGIAKGDIFNQLSVGKGP